MTAQPLEYASSRQHHKSWGVLWLPDDDQPIRGMVQISHGMCEYIERYADFAVWLCQQGYGVCGNDHIGHKNTALLTSQRLGYFGGTNRWPHLIEDVELLRQHLAPRFPGVPWILLGHSMGSFVARLYAEKYGNHLSALILSGTGGSDPMLPAGKALATSTVAYKGPMHVSQALVKLVDGKFSKCLRPGESPSAWVTHDTQQAAKYAGDPYCSFHFTASAYHDLFAMNQQCNRRQWFASLPRELPVLLFSGEEDPVGNFGKGVRQVAAGLEKAGMQQVTVKLYPGGRHEMLNELCRQQVYEDVCSWIDETLKDRP